MNKETKYGSDECYCVLPSGWQTTSPIEIWLDIGLGHKDCIAVANDKYYAMAIVDAMNSRKELEVVV